MVFLVITFMFQFLLNGKEKLLSVIITNRPCVEEQTWAPSLEVSTAETISNSFVLRHYSCLRDDVDLHILPAYLRLFEGKLAEIFLSTAC